MPRHDVTLLGRSYSLSCDEGQEPRLEALAGYVDSKLRKLQAAMAGANENRLLVLACLMLADELFDARAQTAEAERRVLAQENQEEEIIVAAIGHLQGRIENLAKRLATA